MTLLVIGDVPGSCSTLPADNLTVRAPGHWNGIDTGLAGKTPASATKVNVTSSVPAGGGTGTAIVAVDSSARLNGTRPRTVSPLEAVTEPRQPSLPVLQLTWAPTSRVSRRRRRPR